MAKKKTHEEFLKEVEEMTMGEYQVLGMYVGGNKKITMKHNNESCKFYEYPVNPSSFLSGIRCPKCAGVAKPTHDQFCAEIFKLVGTEYSVIGQYISSKKKLDVLHLVCKNTYEVKPNSFLNGSRCPYCYGNIKKTTDQFKSEVNSLVGEGYLVLGEYINNNTKINMFHVICETEYKVKPNGFLNGARCPHCFGNVKLTTEQYIDEVFKLVGNEYKVLGEYINSKVVVLMIHEECGNFWSPYPYSFLGGARCLTCFGNPKKTNDQFREEVFTLVGDEYEYYGGYETVNIKLDFKHLVCGYSYKVTPNDFINSGSRCPKCAGHPKKDTEYFKNEVFNLVGREYIVLGEYVGTESKINIKHNLCNFKWDITPHSFLAGTRCPKCSGRIKNKSTEYYKQEVFKLVGNEYSVLGEYQKGRGKIKFKHNICGFEWDIQKNSFLSGTRCPQCSESKGEMRIRLFLERNNIFNISEFSFIDCKNKNKLPFDFVVLENEKTICAIEFDGKQHEKPIDFFGGEKAYNSLVKRDAIKTNYCIINNIPLIRISYRDYDHIEEILRNELIKLNINIAM